MKSTYEYLLDTCKVFEDICDEVMNFTTIPNTYHGASWKSEKDYDFGRLTPEWMAANKSRDKYVFSVPYPDVDIYVDDETRKVTYLYYGKTEGKGCITLPEDALTDTVKAKKVHDRVEITVNRKREEPKGRKISITDVNAEK